MKKIIYTLLIAFSVTVALSSCTEEEVKPKNEIMSNGGGHADPGEVF